MFELTKKNSYLNCPCLLPDLSKEKVSGQCNQKQWVYLHHRHFRHHGWNLVVSRDVWIFSTMVNKCMLILKWPNKMANSPGPKESVSGVAVLTAELRKILLPP